MVTIENFSQAVEYKFTGGSSYGWNCFGPDARWLDAEDKTYSASIVFGGPDHTVFVAEVCDYPNRRAYRWVHPDYKEAHDAEVLEREVNNLQAWDDVNYCELETGEDFLEKCKAIIAGRDYDTRVSVPLDIPDEDLLKFMLAAHERDMTFNQFVEEALKVAIEEYKRDPEGMVARAKQFVARA